jgi:hypothetical protein
MSWGSNAQHDDTQHYNTCYCYAECHDIRLLRLLLPNVFNLKPEIVFINFLKIILRSFSCQDGKLKKGAMTLVSTAVNITTFCIMNVSINDIQYINYAALIVLC